VGLLPPQFIHGAGIREHKFKSPNLEISAEMDFADVMSKEE
jgi:hypothetical protein